ncbi:MAG: SRPBCC family protein [Candidatus Hydrothermarchaeales archaeon]
MGRVEESIEINATPERVFELISDLDRYSDFIPGVSEVKKLDETKSQWKAEAFGVPLTWASEFVKWDENEEISWKSYDGIGNDGTWRIDNLGEDKCKLTFIMEYELPKSLGFFGSFLDQGILVGELEKRVSQGLLKIKTLAEGK